MFATAAHGSIPQFTGRSMHVIASAIATITLSLAATALIVLWTPGSPSTPDVAVALLVAE